MIQSIAEATNNNIFEFRKLLEPKGFCFSTYLSDNERKDVYYGIDAITLKPFVCNAEVATWTDDDPDNEKIDNSFWQKTVIDSDFNIFEDINSSKMFLEKFLTQEELKEFCGEYEKNLQDIKTTISELGKIFFPKN